MIDPSARVDLKIDVLTPLHIGAGGPNLRHEIDYLSGQQIHVVDHERLFATLSDQEITSIHDFALSRMLNDDGAQIARYSLINPASTTHAAQPTFIPEIVPQMKNAFGKPYVPGTSIKGAIRTALFWSLQRSRALALVLNTPSDPNRRADPRVADQRMEIAAFSDQQLLDPKTDPLRLLRVSDTQPLDGHALTLDQTVVYSTRQSRLVEKRTGMGAQAGIMAFFVETIRPDQILHTHVTLDSWLLNHAHLSALQFTTAAAAMPLWMASCAAFSQAIIAHEIDFYTQYGQPAIAAWYRGLAQMAVQALADGSVLMQFGWGTGWIAKTLGPDLLHPDRADDLAEVRETYWLGRKEVNLFPKSRRLVSRDGTLLPLGWVRLRTGSATPIVVPVAPATAAPAPIPALRVNDLVIGVVSRFAQRDEVETFIKLERGDEVRLQTREIAERPVAHPQDILRLKQKVRVRILRIRGNQIDVTMRGVSQEQLDGAQ